MPGSHELWDTMAALPTSLPFAIALPILVALVLASIADWLERRLTTDQASTSQDLADNTATSANQRWRHARTGRPLLAPVDRNRERA
jgi:hypothetical protein